ncbi:MAG: DUF1549 domain-containing protein [Planctomycetota bacterium]
MRYTLPAVAVLALLVNCSTTLAAEQLTFEHDIRPIFKVYCLNCHGATDELQGGLDLRLRRFAEQGGESGAAIVPGDAESSYLVERLADDEMVPLPHANLAPDQIEKLVATGLLRMAADGTGSGSNDDAARNQTIADTIKIVSTSLLGLSVGCAQCHDHRYDPIPQQDYYQLRAVFEPALS